VIARAPIPGLDARVFEANQLTPDGARQFVSELLAGDDTLLPEAVSLADLAQGSPLMAFLLVEEAKRRRADPNWLQTLSATTVPGFLESKYQRLDETSKSLLRRVALLHLEEEIDADAAAALLEVDAAAASDPLSAVQGMFGASKTRVDRAVRDFAEKKLREVEPDRIPALHASIRRWRAERYGVLPRARLTRDYWTTKDMLGYRPYANAISAFIRHRDTFPPLTIGIKGPWGAGKTSLMRMVQMELDPRDLQGNQHEIRLTEESRAALRRWGRRPRPEDRITMGELLDRAGTSPDSATFRSAELRAQVTASGRPRTDWRPTVWFNPWMYQNSEQVWAGLASQVISQVTRRLATGDRERFWLLLNLTRLDGEALRRSIYKLMLGRLLPTVLGLILLTVIAVPFLAARLIPHTVVLGVGSFYLVVASLLQILFFLRGSASSSFNQLLRQPAVQGFPAELGATLAASLSDPEYAAKAGFLHVVQEDVRHILDLVATPQQPLVVFVDDLDRCSPGTVTEVIEAINLFLAGEFPNCIFVMAMEPELLAAHVEVVYKDLIEVLKDGGRNASWSTLGWHFLDKIVQLPLSLPPVADKGYLDGYMRDLLDMRPLTIRDGTAGASGLSAPGSALGSAGTPLARASWGSGTGEATSPAQDPGVDSLLAVNTDLADELEQAIRLKDPSIDDLPNVGMEAQREVTGQAGPMLQETIVAIDRVFADLYSDAAAWTAISSMLPRFGSSNPRDLKRYLNLFRFYAFIAQRRHLDGITPPSAQQIAKATALAIRWPQLLTALGANRGTDKIIRRLEAACRDAEEWHKELEDAGLPAGDYTELQEFLATGEPVSDAAALLF
jgi:hypothetical protein